MENKHVVHLYLTEAEFEFLKKSASVLQKTYAQTMMTLSDFSNRMLDDKNNKEGLVIKDVPFTAKPFDDYGDTY